MKPLLIAGNWKMNKTISEALELAKMLRQELQNLRVEKIEIVVAPPYTALNRVAEFFLLVDSFVSVSAQDLFWEDSGAFTGAISAPMIKDVGAKYVIIGHSERRQLFNETDDTVNKKIKAALKADLMPIFCVGETLQERESGKMRAIVENQLSQGLVGITGNDMEKVTIAYEPVWAIGTGKTATPEQAEEAHAMIRKMLYEKFGLSIANIVKVIYGGSVKPSNSKELLSKINIDGVLVGSASLKAEDFINIIINARSDQ